MKRFSFLLFSVVLPLSVVSAQSTRVVTVKFQQVFEEYRPLQEMDRRMRAELQQFREEQAAKMEALQERNRAFEALRGRAAREGLSVEERERLIDEATGLFESLQESQQKLRREQEQFNENLQARLERLRREVVDSIQEQIQEMSRDRGWAVVLDATARGGNGLPVVLHADPGTDVTREVIRSLNRAAAERELEEEGAADDGADDGAGE